MLTIFLPSQSDSIGLWRFRLGLLKRIVPTKWLAALDGLFQPTGELFQVTPSVFVRARKVGRDSISTYNGVVLQCPECGQHPLDAKPEKLTCPACGKNYLIRDGIYDFREPE